MMSVCSIVSPSATGRRCRRSGSASPISPIRRPSTICCLNIESKPLFTSRRSRLVGESVKHPARYWQNNLVNTLALLDLCRRHGVSRFVFSSTCATYGVPEKVPMTEETPQRPISPYGQSKLAVEQALADYAAAYGLGYAALRYFNAAGAAADGTIGEDHHPESHLIPLVLQVALGQRPRIEVFGTDYPTPDGTCIRDYIHVDDLAEAHLLALEKIEPGKGLC